MRANIAVLPGDGVGPEVVEAAQGVLSAAAERFGRAVDFAAYPIGGNAIDVYNDPLPESTLTACRAADAVLLGAVGGPKWSDPLAPIRPEQGLLKIRKELGLFANLRPVRVAPALLAASPLKAEIVRDVDVLVVRELTGGIYFGERGRRQTPDGEAAFDTLIYSVPEIERVTRLAARLACQRRGKLTSVDKANVLESSRLWRATVNRVMAGEFADVQCDHVLVDAAAMYLITRPAQFDVIVTENMFGDILTDEASVLAGSMGMLPSASLGAGKLGLYEPIHGSAPDIAGKGVANPIGTILSAALLARWSLGWDDVATAIEQAVDEVVAEGVRTADIVDRTNDAPGTAVGTQAMGAAIAERVTRIEVAAAASYAGN